MRRRYGWDLALVLITVAWGATFVPVKRAVEVISPMPFLALRFLIAAIAIAAVRPAQTRAAKRIDVGGGIVAGVLLFVSYATQTIALQYASVANVGFITGTYVVMVPVFAALVLRKLPSRAASVAVLLATAGLYLLARPSGSQFGKGEILTIFTAASFAVQILVIARIAERINLVAFSVVQLLTVAVCAGLAGIGGHVAGFSRVIVWGTILLTALVATSFAYFVQAAAQRVVSPTRVALILAMESVFAALFGFWFAGERIGAIGWAGGALILAGVLVGELLAPEREVA
ncbi:MAG: DMT family transporter [Actinomycetota bacterium]|nr:DMT family transporter [Actinomycetota bacterium]